MKLFFRSEEEIKTFLDKQKLREIVASRSALQEILKEVLQREGKQYRSDTWIYIKKGNIRERISESKIKIFIFLN